VLQISVFINMFVTCVFAAGFYGKGEEDIGLANAGQYLGQVYGPHLTYIWALGLLAAGQSSTMTGTYTGQFVMGGYLDLKLSPWKRVCVTRGIALVPTLLVALLSQSDTGLDTLNQWLNLLQSIQLPFALIPVIAFNSSPRIMGKFANSTGLTVVTGLIALGVMVVNISGVYSFTAAVMTGVGVHWWVLLGTVVLLYLTFISYLFVHATWVGGLWPEQLTITTGSSPSQLPLPIGSFANLEGEITSSEDPGSSVSGPGSSSSSRWREESPRNIQQQQQRAPAGAWMFSDDDQAAVVALRQPLLLPGEEDAAAVAAVGGDAAGESSLRGQSPSGASQV
jgi:hypothetical protein